MHFSATDPASSRSKALLQSRTGPGINSRAADEFAQSVRGWHSGSSAKSAAEISLAQLDLAETTFGRIAPPPRTVLLFRQADKLTISRLFRLKSVVVFFMLIFLFWSLTPSITQEGPGLFQEVFWCRVSNASDLMQLSSPSPGGEYVFSVPTSPGMAAGASPIGAQSSSSARYGRIRYRAELELRAPDGRGQCSRAGCAKQILRPPDGRTLKIAPSPGLMRFAGQSCGQDRSATLQCSR